MKWAASGLIRKTFSFQNIVIWHMLWDYRVLIKDTPLPPFTSFCSTSWTHCLEDFCSLFFFALFVKDMFQTLGPQTKQHLRRILDWFFPLSSILKMKIYEDHEETGFHLHFLLYLECVSDPPCIIISCSLCVSNRSIPVE